MSYSRCKNCKLKNKLYCELHQTQIGFVASCDKKVIKWNFEGVKLNE